MERNASKTPSRLRSLTFAPVIPESSTEPTKPIRYPRSSASQTDATGRWSLSSEASSRACRYADPRTASAAGHFLPPSAQSRRCPLPCSSDNSTPPPARPPASRSRLGGLPTSSPLPSPAGRWRLQPPVAQTATRQASLRHRPSLLAARFRLLRRAFDLHLHATVGLPLCHGREQPPP